MAPEEVLDVSAFFWSFVNDVTVMTYADLYRTAGFLELSNARGRLSVSCEILGVGAVSVPEGVFKDERNGCYIFPDVTSLMRGTPIMVTDPVKRRALEACLHRIVCFVEVADLATDLEHHVLDD